MLFRSLSQRFPRRMGQARSMSIWKSYCDALERRPLVIKSLTSAGLSFSADMLCQVAVPYLNDQSDVKMDWTRTLKFSILGGLLVGPTLHFWYGFLARKIAGSGVAATLKRLACDQMIFAPCFIQIFFSVSLLLDGKPELIVDKIKNDAISTIISNYFVWIPAQFVNFKLMPPQFQVLFSNFVGFFWNVYFSYANYKGHEKIADASDIEKGSA